MMRQSFPNGSGLIQQESALIHRAQGLSECFDKDEDHVNHYGLHSDQRLTQLNIYERFCTDMLDSTSIIKTLI